MYTRKNVHRFIAEETLSLGTCVLACGHEVVSEPAPGAAEWVKEFYALVYLVHGKGSFASARCPRRDVRSGQVFLIFPGEPHVYGPCPGGLWEEYWFRFQGQTVRDLEAGGILDRAHALYTPGVRGEIVDMLDRCMLVAEDRCADKRRITGMFLRLLNAFVTEGRAHAGSPARERSMLVVRQVRSAPERDWDFRRIAEEQGMSYSLLRKEFVRITGIPPCRFLSRERMKLAGAVLSDGGSVREATRAVGLEDPYYFSRRFKQVMGQCPSTFVRTMTAGSSPGRARPSDEPPRRRHREP